MHYQILPLWFLQVNFSLHLTPPKCIYTRQNNVQLLIWPYFIVQKHIDFVELFYNICPNNHLQLQNLYILL
jgi:hypothetical protein